MNILKNNQKALFHFTYLKRLNEVIGMHVKLNIPTEVEFRYR
ncbi:hypothetical protein PthstB1num2_11730 [Parageobacillus thermoglucosidasius]|nr:hypothetical protein PthstB1num2_11730 [Parageobacillus thermoglucosidasius]